MTVTVSYASYAASASATKACVRSTSQRSSGAVVAGVSSSNDGVKPAMFAYSTKNETEFQNVRKRRLTSSASA
jgi:hypothetical protein